MKIKLLTGLLAAAMLPSVSGAVTKNQSPTPIDPALVNEERIIYWLEKRGDITESSSEAERDAALSRYLEGMNNQKVKLPKIEQARLQKNHDAYIKNEQLAQKSAADKTVKVLAVLIDFPDLKHSSHGLTSDDTDMYYSSYPVSHYQDLMFSTTGFTGPSGQNFTSGYQYYQNESGGTFNFTGQTFGWVTADNNAKHYGANDDESDAKDTNVPALIKEAVTKAVAANSINLSDYDIEDPYDLDGDGNVDESDGIIDHVMVYHSSIGEEAGGGDLGSDAIWSHRFFVDTNTNGYTIPGTDKKLFGYTVQPIDAATGVVVHEFGHDLGVPDEYDISGSSIGSPVALWSVMGGGSWAGVIRGTEPTGFSPYARAYFQSLLGGNWIDEQVIDFEAMAIGSQSIDLVEAVNHNATNQIRIDMPQPLVDFAAPYSGAYQYYSDEGHYMDNSLSFDTDIPASGTTTLTMKARWDIEVDYDYAQVLVNGTPLAGNHTKVNNQYHSSVKNFITGKSKDIAGAEGTLGWVDLTFDMSAYAGDSVTVSINYVTDPAVGGYGFIADDITLSNGSNFFNDGAETDGSVSLNGFLRVDDKKPGKPQNYWVQLRSENGQDSGFADSVYTPGILVWFADEAYTDNKVEEHPGHGFLGVVDADQNPVKRYDSIASSTLQVIDAAFGLYAQKSYSGDSNLQPTAKFDDSLDYSFPEQPESGLNLPTHGLSVEVTAQAGDSSSATVKISKATPALNADFGLDIDYKTVTFNNATEGGDNNYTYAWSFGDGSAASSEASPTHTFAQSGDYTVRLTVTDGESTVDSKTKTVSIAEKLQAEIVLSVDGAQVTVSPSVIGGSPEFSYSWDFGDGAKTTVEAGEHTYELTNQYTVSLTVTSSDKQAVEVTKQINVVVPITAVISNSTDGLSANFSSNVNGGDGDYTYSWDFGDGTSSSSATPGHVYTSAGTYGVVLTITDSTGAESTASKSVTVQEKSSDGGGGSSSLWLLLLLASGMVFRRKR
ncbi:M6 family metalloprotease domain-containing protein [Kangiella sp. HD9-110m-PIT-SAG07]|nr:M6 family metalloprotease domain-containing protein [Kangiella sp. HD9-110m-PIT-SAG07]